MKNKVYARGFSGSTSKDDRVDLPQPLVPHKRTVTDSFLSRILKDIYNAGKELGTTKKKLQKQMSKKVLHK